MDQPWKKLYRTLAAATIVIAACNPSPGNLTVVTGKTVFGDMALEGVSLQIHKWSEDGWNHHGDAKSGYHGSFRLHLPPGEYMITATHTVRLGDRDVFLSGDLNALVVKEGEKRMDRLVIEMN